MKKPTDVHLREFLKNSNLAVPNSPPWVHSSPSSKLISIINEEKRMAMECTVFKRDKLCYLFVGRAAYKTKDTPNPTSWQLPSVFVMRFQEPPLIKRIFPFDTGAFAKGRLPDYITTFDMRNFELGDDRDQIGRLISLYFTTPRRYVDRMAVDEEGLKEQHVLDMRHAEILALGKLYKQGSTRNFDDRAAAIEIQLEQDILLKKENLLGVVIPEEYTRTRGLLQSLKQLTDRVETYHLLPLSLREHYSAIYECVERIYKKAGVRIDA